MMRSVVGIVLLAIAGSCASGGGDAPPARPAVAPVVAPAPTPPAPTPPKDGFPDTPAGHTLRAWLDAFNSADAAQLQAFVARYKPRMSADELLGFRTQTGGFELVAIAHGDRRAVKFVVKEKASPTQAVGWLKVKDADPAEIESFTLLAIPPGMTAAEMDISVDAATRARVVDAIAAKLTELYVFPDVATKMIAAVRDHARKGDYDALDDATELAVRLTDDLRAVSHDRHLRVQFVPRALPEHEAEPTAEDKARQRDQLERIHCGFQKAERLDGNIGYVKFDMFGDPEVCGPTATAALRSLGKVDALIFDLRDNGGGQPEMVAFVASYLFGKRTHLNDIYSRKDNKTTPYWTDPKLPGPRFVKQPVYVLTSRRTFSGAEEFSYDLQTLERATIVGETTGGGAHPTMPQRLDTHFLIGVPFARAINPITKRNWEGTGVIPDVQVAADQALDTARKLAAERLAKRKPRR